MTPKLLLIGGTSGAIAALVALFFACRGANVSDCIGIAVVGLILSVACGAALWATEPEAWL